VSAFWFGLSNAAREIIGEAPLVRRELMIGARPASYLGAKLLVLAGCGLIQAILIVLVVSLLQPSAMHIPLPVKPANGLMGGQFWPHAEFVLVLFMLAGVGTTIGLMISAYARSVSWAIAAVPLVTIPHLAFSDKVFGVGTEISPRGVLYLFNAVEYGYRWLRDVHDSSTAACWTIAGIRISYPFLALTIMLAGFFLCALAVLRRRYLSAQ